MIIKQFGNNYVRLKDRIIVWQKLITFCWKRVHRTPVQWKMFN